MRVIESKMGTAKRNRGSGPLNWSMVVRAFPEYRSHVMRIRNDQRKLIRLVERLVKKYGRRHEKLLWREGFRSE